MSTYYLLLIIIFWVCMSLIAYAYALYPIVIWSLARSKGHVSKTPECSLDHFPSLTLLIAAYNEETVIEERIRNALKMDYPRECFEIVIGLDGCSDGTAAIARRFEDCGVRVLDYSRRSGKATVLNQAIAEVDGEIVMLSDANTDIDPQAARRLVRWFQDPRVGAVVGRLVLTDPRSGGNADGAYWKYENFLKRCEGRLEGLLGANGAIYAIRRELYVPIPGGTIIDDFVIPLLAKLRSGCSIVYDAEAVAHEETPPDVASEFHRRARIGAGGFQSIALLWKLLDPRRGWVAFTFLSHKLMRWLCPFFMIGMFATSALLWEHSFFRWAFAAQVLFYGVTLLAMLAPRGTSLPKPIRIMSMFTSMNAALFVGFIRWARGTQNAAWRRTSRLPEITGVIP